ncbi:MAG: hypothetical protein EA420_16435 [Candidatus Competibacteraceae bacterium]|nr:MAG: hypothetical protein EA420_16435 [Candidatus Competibacteraceae bacterium]
MKVYVTKYALTKGILEHDATVGEDGWAYVSEYAMSFSRKNWAPTMPEALAQAEEKRVQKIASLRKQIAKLERLEF